MITNLTVEKLNELASLEELLFSNPWSQSQLASHIRSNNPVYIACNSSGTIIGYLIVSDVLGEWEIFRIAVVPQFRRQGIAKQLLEHLETVAKEGDSIFLEVRDSNIPAKNLYISWGYSECGRRASYYHDGEDAVIMMKSL